MLFDQINSLTVKNILATSEGSDQTGRMHIMRNNSVKLFFIWGSGSGDVV